MDRRKPVLQACGLGRRKPGSDQWLIRGICMAILPGDRIALGGPSGSGKTVLLRALSLLDPIDEGSIEWKGEPIRGDALPAYRKEVLYVHQRPALLEGNVEENLRRPFSLKVHRGREFDRERIVALLEDLGRDAAFLWKSSRDLSGGEAQIVALLRAIQLDPTVLLLDEATAALDPATVAAVERLLDHWWSEAPGERAIVLISHNPEQAGRFADRRLHMSAGGMVSER